MSMRFLILLISSFALAQHVTFENMNLNLHSVGQKINILSRNVASCAQMLCLESPTLTYQKKDALMTLKAETGKIDQKFNELTATNVHLQTSKWDATANLITYFKSKELIILDQAALTLLNFKIISPQTRINLSQQDFKIKGPWSITYDKNQ